MISIYQIVQQALSSGYLTLAAEEQLRELLKTHYDTQDFEAFMLLQEAAREGFVTQESRELLRKETSNAAGQSRLRSSTNQGLPGSQIFSPFCTLLPIC